MIKVFLFVKQVKLKHRAKAQLECIDTHAPIAMVTARSDH